MTPTKNLNNEAQSQKRFQYKAVRNITQSARQRRNVIYRHARSRQLQLPAPSPTRCGMGMQLLQKMGWNPGEGLGRDRTGPQEPLQVPSVSQFIGRRGLQAPDECVQTDAAADGQTHIKASTKKRPRSTKEIREVYQDKHPVSLLSEVVSKRRWSAPVYTTIYEGNSTLGKTFYLGVSVEGVSYTPPTGECISKKEAKLNAARYCLQQIGVLEE